MWHYLGRFNRSILSLVKNIYKKEEKMRKFKKLSVLCIAVSIVVLLVAPALNAEPGKINLNTATVEELTQLKRVGFKYAERIVKFREENGAFKTTEDILKVPGIGTKTFELNKDRIIVE